LDASNSALDVIILPITSSGAGYKLAFTAIHSIKFAGFLTVFTVDSPRIIRFVLVGHPRDTIAALSRDRWAVLGLLVAPSGDFK
jgi:hypothetical protein